MGRTLFTLALLGLAFYTRPSHRSFKKVLKKSLEQDLNREQGGFRAINKLLAKGAAWIVRQIANYEYENFHVFAVESVRDENGEKNFVALGVLGFWLMLDKKGQSIKALQADDSDDE